ncbi:MAG: hypothetical protein ACM34I_09200 [bacterium]
MPWICPECGFKNEDAAPLCVCGYHAQELDAISSADWESPTSIKSDERDLEEPPTIIESGTPPPPKAKPRNLKMKMPEKPAEKHAAPKRDKAGAEIILKEIDAWKFSYSPADHCIYIGTPALHPFRLTLTMDDLEKWLEFMYEQSGSGKSLRQPQLSGNDILEIIENIDTIIESKKSKIKLHFSAEELQNMADIINKKLSE